MSLYRRFARSKKGMSTIFGGLFFIILILMGFNVMLWGFVQWDSYNHVLASMSQRDQQAVSENIVPVNSTYTSGTGAFIIWVNNLGGSSVSISQIYISNVNNTGNCQPTPCYSPSYFTFTGGGIPAGSVNYPIHVSGFTPASGTQYHITLASSRGRLFSLYYPWKFNSLTINNNGNGGQFVTNIGPLAIYFDFKSFNYTTGTSGACSGAPGFGSCSAFCMPTSSVVLYIRVANTVQPTPGVPSDVKILSQTAIQAEGYGVKGFGQFVNAWIEANNTVNPANSFAYNYAGAPYDLQPQGPNGPVPSSFAVLKFGAGNIFGTGGVSFPNTDVSWITNIGIYYLYQGKAQGQTIPFMDFVTSYPNCVY